jgi:hypothetical protein
MVRAALLLVVAVAALIVLGDQVLGGVDNVDDSGCDSLLGECLRARQKAASAAVAAVALAGIVVALARDGLRPRRGAERPLPRMAGV